MQNNIVHLGCRKNIPFYHNIYAHSNETILDYEPISSIFKCISRCVYELLNSVTLNRCSSFSILESNTEFVFKAYQSKYMVRSKYCLEIMTCDAINFQTLLPHFPTESHQLPKLDYYIKNPMRKSMHYLSLSNRF